MKKGLNYLKDRINKEEKERERFLNNFYTKRIKNGKTTRADYLDKISINICIFIILFFILNKVIGNFIIALLIGLIIMIVFTKNKIHRNKKNRLIKIEEIKKEYRIELEKENKISDDENIENYIVNKYYEEKSEHISNINLLSKDKVFKLYLLFIIFFFSSLFVKYSIYYKIIGIIAFIMATLIGSYNITEYMRNRN